VKIALRFDGGPLDGKRVVGNPDEDDEAEKYFALSYHGRLGQVFRIASDYAVETLARERLKVQRPHGFQSHRYEIALRHQRGDVIMLLARYVREATVAS
jgi:hypothetical protein